MDLNLAKYLSEVPIIIFVLKKRSSSTVAAYSKGEFERKKERKNLSLSERFRKSVELE